MSHVTLHSNIDCEALLPPKDQPKDQAKDQAMLRTHRM